MDKSFIKKMGWAVLSYIVIYAVAVVFAIFRLSTREDAVKEFGLWDILQLFVFPVLFFAAGYIGTAKHEFPKMKFRFALLFAFIFSGLITGLWYLSRAAFVGLNLPVVQGCYGLDHWMRNLDIVYKYEYTYLGKTDLYEYAVLPFTYFVTDMICWLCYMWGNVSCVSRRTKK